uniref:Basement membrane proteoglycan n=1 Tax=Panagrellus redivivus TaxID=6233 RepID=A0A7E4ZZ11_PANRE
MLARTLDTRGDTVAPPDPSASSEEAPTTTAEPLPAIVEPMTTTTETTEEIKTSETVNVIEEEPESSEIVTVQPSEDPPTTVPTTPEQQTFYTATPDVLPETTIMPIERESLVEQARRVPVVATHGTETKLKCPTYTSDSAAEITWEKIGEQMPLAYHIADGSLILTNASKEDAGIYQCSVRQASGAGTVSFVDLRVAEFVPSFRGKNVIELPPLTDHDWKELDLELSIKPSSRDGVIFHTTRGGQDGSTPEQYHTVSLRHGKVVYESKLTQGPPEVLESENIVRVGKWSKIRIQNTPDELSLRVNTDPAVMAAIPSEVVLSETPANNVFVGGDPDDDAAGHKFVGVISRLLVGHKAVPFSPKVVSQSVAARTNVELEAANECASMPCQNEGICLPAQVHEGFICECSELFHGTHCQFKGRKCANGETCENGACVDVAESNSAKCVCPIDKEGVSCEEPVSPRRKFDGAYHFNGKTSYLAIPPPSSVKDFTLSMNLHVKDAVKNQIVAYLGSHYNQRTAEYMSIAIKNGRLVNSYQNGAGKSEIESLAELEPGRTYHIQVSRTGHMAEVSVNGMKSTSRLKTVAFPSGTSVFIGGFPPGMQPRKQVAVMEFFNGCISEVELDAVRVDIDSNLGGGVISGDLEACNSTSLSTTQVTVEDEENDFDVKSEEAELTETPEEESEEEEEEPSTTAEPSTTTELPIVAVPTNLPHGGGAGGGWDSEEIEPAAIISENGAEVSVVPTDITNEVETTIRTGVIVPVKLPQEPISAEVTPPEAPEPYTTVLAPIDEEGDEVTVGAPLTTPEPVPINLPMSVDEEVEPPLDEDDFEVVDLPSTIPTEESVDASTTSTTPSPYALCETMTCGEHGECTVVNSTTVACQCMDYYDGPNCSNFKPIEYAAKFDGTAYVVFSADDFPHLTSEREETVSFRVKTTAKYGVIFWQGQQPDSAIVGEDYISIGLNDGYLVYSYELGGGAAQIVSTIPINDGKEHVIRVVRRGRNGTLIVDNEPVIRGTSSGILAMLNVEGDVYIGGVPDLQLMTAGLHSHNFVGCVADVLLNHVKMDLMANAIDGVNVKPCDSWRTARRRWMKSKKYRKLVIG